MIGTSRKTPDSAITVKFFEEYEPMNVRTLDTQKIIGLPSRVELFVFHSKRIANVSRRPVQGSQVILKSHY